MTDKHTDLQTKVELLYEIFARYPLDSDVEGCGCCTTAEDNARIHSKPLRQLTGDDLGRYSFKALTTWGDENDFRHFLPRLLEIATLEVSGSRFANSEIVVSKLQYADWHKWPQDEQVAITSFMEVFWTSVLDGNMPRTFPDIEMCLCTIAQAINDLSPYLQQWLKAETTFAYGALAEFISGNVYRSEGLITLSNPFWDTRQQQMRQVIDWLLDKHTIEYLERLFYGSLKDSFAIPLADAIDNLTWLRRL